MRYRNIKKSYTSNHKLVFVFASVIFFGSLLLLDLTSIKSYAATTPPAPIYTFSPASNPDYVYTFTYVTKGTSNYIDLSVKDTASGTTEPSAAQGFFQFNWTPAGSINSSYNPGGLPGYVYNGAQPSSEYSAFVLDPITYSPGQGGTPQTAEYLYVEGNQNNTDMYLDEFFESGSSQEVSIQVNGGVSSVVAADPTWNNALGNAVSDNTEAGRLEFISPTQIYDTTTDTYYDTSSVGQYATNGTTFLNIGDTVYFPASNATNPAKPTTIDPSQPINGACAGGIVASAGGPGNYINVYLLPTVDIGGSCYYVTPGSGTDNPETTAAAEYYGSEPALFETQSDEITLTASNAMNMAYAMFEWEDSTATTGQGGVGNVVTLTDTSNTLLDLSSGTTYQAQNSAALAAAGASGTNDQVFTTQACMGDAGDFSFLLVKYDSSNSDLTDLDIGSPNATGYFYYESPGTNTWTEGWNNGALNCLLASGSYLAPQSNGAESSNPPYTYIANVSASVNNDLANNPSNPPTPPSTTTTTSPELQCTISIFNPLTWLVCPMITAAEGFVGELDSAITSLLTIDVGTYLCQTGSTTGSCAGAQTSQTTGGGTETTGQQFYQAWNSFRVFALALIVIAALIMVIAQAFGVEAVSAYSLKKLLPRLIVAVIAITLSWEIMKLLVQISDDVGKDISGIIYAPFSGDVTKINDGTISGLAIVAAPGLLVLGWLGALGFILVAAVAVLVGFATLVLRKILVLVFIILAPLAIACAILPATQKAWKLWSNNFLRALIMFPLISGFIAVGRVFAVIAGSNGGNGFEDDIIKLVAWFGPYFMIPTTFKMAGGIMGSVGNFAGNISSRARRLGGGISKSSAAKNWANTKNGRRFAGGNEQNLRGRYNRALKGVTLLPKAGLRPKDFRVKMRQNMRDSDAAELDSVLKGENRAFNAFSGDDAKVSAAQYNSAEQVEAELARFDPGRFAGEANRARREEARVQIMQAKREISSSVFQKARIQAMAKTGTGYQYTDENGQTQFDASRMLADINSAYGNDRNGAGQALAGMRDSLQRSGQMAGAAGYGAWATNLEDLHNGAITAEQAHNNIMDDAINSVTPGQAIYGKPGSAAAMGAAHARRIQAISQGIANGTRTEEDLSVAMAGAAGIYDAMTQASPANASAFANELMSQQVRTFGPPAPNGQEVQTGTVREYIESQMNNNPAFRDRRRDMSRDVALGAQRELQQNLQRDPLEQPQPPTGGPPVPPPFNS